MTELRMFFITLLESEQSLYSTKNPLIINLKGKLRNLFDFFYSCQTRRIWLAHMLVEIPRGFQLGGILVWVNFETPHLLTKLTTKHACQHNSFWGSWCVSNHAPTISLKPVLFYGDFGTYFLFRFDLIPVFPRHTSSIAVYSPP